MPLKANSQVNWVEVQVCEASSWAGPGLTSSSVTSLQELSVTLTPSAACRTMKSVSPFETPPGPRRPSSCPRLLSSCSCGSRLPSCCLHACSARSLSLKNCNACSDSQRYLSFSGSLTFVRKYWRSCETFSDIALSQQPRWFGTSSTWSLHMSTLATPNLSVVLVRCAWAAQGLMLQGQLGMQPLAVLEGALLCPLSPSLVLMAPRHWLVAGNVGVQRRHCRSCLLQAASFLPWASSAHNAADFSRSARRVLRRSNPTAGLVLLHLLAD
mmetsp:Transcript_65764/g.152797  ORF Transcript_65764/g.152797 Transcript_65764/m.152797 type:complete len:269 (-) Transcript_65764:513-1319(-)